MRCTHCCLGNWDTHYHISPRTWGGKREEWREGEGGREGTKARKKDKGEGVRGWILMTNTRKTAHVLE